MFHIAHKVFVYGLVPLFILSLLAVALVGGYISIRGKVKDISRKPAGRFEEVSFTSQAKDALTIHGWFLPGESTQTVVIAHGWGGNRATFIDLADALQAKGLTVLTIDLRGGTGKNTYGEQESGDVAGAVEWLAKEKGISSSQVTLLGNSMGGSAILHYAAAHEVGKIVLISSVFNLRHTRAFYADERHFPLPNLYAWFTGVAERYIFRVKAPNPLADIHKTKAPILILHGNNDRKSPTKDVQDFEVSLSDAEKGRFTFSYIEGGSHTFYEDDPTARQKSIEEVIRFVQL